MTPDPKVRQNDQSHSGSPRSGEPVYLTVGKLRRTHGVKGDLLMEILADSSDIFIPGLTVYIGPKYHEVKVAEVRSANHNLLIRFEGYNDCDKAAHLRNQIVSIRTEIIQPLAEGRYYHHQVVGLKVFDESEKEIGILSEIISTGANDVYVITATAGNEILIPAVKDFVLKFDLENHRMIVKLPQWE